MEDVDLENSAARVADAGNCARKSETGIVPGDPNVMASLVRGLAVIQAFSRETPQMTISQISQETGIPRAAARRCLYTLRLLGFADTEDGRRFWLTPRILALGHAYLSSVPLARLAQPVLRRISNAINESCSMAVIDGDDIVYIARASVSRIMTVDLNVGSRLPAAFTSMGRVLLAYAPDIEERIARVRFKAFTPYTITNVDALRAELTRIREFGHAVVDQELELGLRSIAVPVKNAGGHVAAALNVGVPASRRLITELSDTILPLLEEGAAELSLAIQ